MNDISRLFQAFVAPAIFISATSLLILSINVRLMGIVSRLRQFVHAKHDATKNGRSQEAEAYTAQIRSIEQRAETIRRCFLLVLISLAGMILSSLLLCFGLYWKEAAVAAVIVFVVAMICLLAGTLFYIREVTVALSSVQNEARDLRFMDLGTPAEIRGHQHDVIEEDSLARVSAMLVGGQECPPHSGPSQRPIPRVLRGGEATAANSARTPNVEEPCRSPLPVLSTSSRPARATGSR